MAAEALEAAAAKAGVPLVVETQGSAGSTPLPRETIQAAGAVIFAVDVGVRDRSRFAGKPVVSSGVKRPIDDADSMIAEAVRYANDPNAPRVEGSAGDAGAGGSSAVSETWGGRTRRVLMTGVSYMIPFVAAGGLLIALGFLFGGDEIVNVYGKIAVDNTLFNLPDPEALGLPHALFNSGFFAYLGALFFIIGKTAFIFFVPALAGYIAYAIADRPGIAPGFVMGGLAINVFGVTDGAANNPVSLPATGFLGAILGGVLAGVVAHWITGWKVPAWARGLMPVLVIPLLTCIICGLVMIIVLGKPIGNLINALEDGLNSMSGSNAILLGIVLGLMMAFDMGGPLNKVAYSFAAAGVGVAASAPASDPRLQIMAAVMLAGMVPPIALALATVVRPHLFNIPERENGKAGWLLGASFITEGAIPFAAADPLRVIPPIMLGSAVTGARLDGVQRLRAGTARRHLRALRRAQHPRLLHRPDPRRGRRSGRRHRGQDVLPRQQRRPRHRLTTRFRPTAGPTKGERMPTRTVTVGSAVGLHARPAAIIAEAAGELDSEVTIGVPGDDPVDASSSLLIMTLGAGKGATIEVSGDDQAAVDKIAALVEQDLDA